MKTLPTNRWVLRALLGGAALGAMATTAQADELSALKAQLEALQSRVNSIELPAANAGQAGYPEGASFITYRRGSYLGDEKGLKDRIQGRMPDDRGFTIAITPTADLPAPVMEVSVSGYVKADFIYDTHNNVGRSVSANAVAIGGGDDENFQAHAYQSRFRVRSRSDTAVGQIRTYIEGDFEGSPFGTTTSFRLRHALGEWDMSPNLTLGAGQTWTNFMPLNGVAPTVDFGGPTGIPFVRQAMIRLTHRSGPITTHVSLEDPNTDLRTSGGTAVSAGAGSGVANQLPDATAAVQYQVPGGALIHVSGIVRELHIDSSAPGGVTTNDSELGWGVNTAVDLPLGDMITLYGSFTYGDGLGRYLLNAGNRSGVINPGGGIDTTEVYGVTGGASLRLSEASSINANYGYEHHGNALASADTRTLQTAHLNYMWQPVSKLRMGLEGIWIERTLAGGVDDDNVRVQFGTWFFF